MIHISEEERKQLKDFAKTMRKLKKGDMRDWTMEEVAFWVTTVGLPENSPELPLLKQAIIHHNIDGNKLYFMNEASFKELDKFDDIQLSTLNMLLAVKRAYMSPSRFTTEPAQMNAEDQEKLLKAVLQSQQEVVV
jgi:hypothetical protein